MRTIRVTFDDGDTLTTNINGTEAEIRAYYLGQVSDHYPDGPDGREVLRKAVKVEFWYSALFIGRKVGAIGAFYPIHAHVWGEDIKAAELALYEKYDHIQRLILEPRNA